MHGVMEYLRIILWNELLVVPPMHQTELHFERLQSPDSICIT